MKKKSLIQFLTSSLTVAALITCGTAGTTFAECEDMESLMSEGISYNCEAGQKTLLAKNDTRINMEAMMNEGLVDKDSFIAADQKVIITRYKRALIEGLEGCYCEGPAMTDSEAQVALHRKKALSSKPAAGNTQ